MNAHKNTWTEWSIQESTGRDLSLDQELLSQEPHAKIFAAGDQRKQLMESLGPSGTGASWKGN